MEKTMMPAELCNVTVTDSYYDEALHIEVKNMLLLDADRLMAGFRETAGCIAGMKKEELDKFMKRKERYGGAWEDGLIGGHTLGHYITALAQAVVNPGLNVEVRRKVRERLDYMIDSLKECQDYTEGTPYEGYLFGGTLPTKEFRDNPALQFDNVEKGLQDLFTQAWVPWYTMHKILSGFNAAFKIAGNRKSLEIANRLGRWIANRTEGWSSQTQNTVLSIEYGGMNDCLYELYQINRNLKEQKSSLCCSDFERFKVAAHSFDETELFEKVLSGKEDVLDNIHANTTIPKFIGALARYETDNSQGNYLQYAESFWDMVISRHTYITGGNSEDEHFGRDNILDAERTNVNNETCNTYNMLKFSRRLYTATGKKKYLDYCDRTLINAIMASQNHKTGFTTYFQPMGTGYQKVFNTLDGNFWCCTGTGYENFTKLQDGIYFKGKGILLVSLYLASTCKCDGYTLIQECDFTKSDEVVIRIEPDNKAMSDDLYLRIPEWVKGTPTLILGDTNIEPREQNGFYIIPREMLVAGGELKIKWPMGITCENLPDGKDTFGFCYGPYVLSARLGAAKIRETTHGVAVNVAAEKSVDSDELFITDENSVGEFIENIEKHLIKRPGEMEFDLKGASKPLVFTTHYNQYIESYGIYWHFTTG